MGGRNRPFPVVLQPLKETAFSSEPRMDVWPTKVKGGSGHPSSADLGACLCLNFLEPL